MENKECKSCHCATRELRMGHCWDCATAESIIVDGTDMYERGIDGGDIPAKTGMEKLSLLIQKGLYRKS